MNNKELSENIKNDNKIHHIIEDLIVPKGNLLINEPGLFMIVKYRSMHTKLNKRPLVCKLKYCIN